MGSGVPIRVSKELREALGKMKSHPSESYDMLLRRKLEMKKARKNALKSKLSFPDFKPGKATKKVLKSDKRVTKNFLMSP